MYRPGRVMHRLVIVLGLFVSSCSVVEPGSAPSTPASPQANSTVSARDAGETVESIEPAAARPTTFERQRFDVKADDGHALAVWAKVPAQPRGAIVLLHGRTWSGRPDFDLQVPGEQRSTMDALAREGFAAYALDLRGYGGTARDATEWNTPDRATKDLLTVLAWVQERHERAPALLGWSLGSLTAQLAAQREPDRVSALVLFGYPRSPDRKYRRDKPAEPAKAATTAKAAAEDFIIPGTISQPAIDAFVEQALASDPVRSDWRGTEQWSELDPAKVRVPTLLIHGAKDPYAPIANQAPLFSRLGHDDRAWVIVANGDHAAHLEDSGPRFVQAVVTFLDRP